MSGRIPPQSAIVYPPNIQTAYQVPFSSTANGGSVIILPLPQHTVSQHLPSGPSPSAFLEEVKRHIEITEQVLKRARLELAARPPESAPKRLRSATQAVDVRFVQEIEGPPLTFTQVQYSFPTLQKLHRMIALCGVRPYGPTELSKEIGVKEARARELIHIGCNQGDLIAIGQVQFVKGSRMSCVYATPRCADTWDATKTYRLWPGCTFQPCTWVSTEECQEQIIALCDRTALTLTQISQHLDVGEWQTRDWLGRLKYAQRLDRYGDDEWVTPRLKAALDAQEGTPQATAL